MTSVYGEIVSVITRIQLSVDHQDVQAFADCYTNDTLQTIEQYNGDVSHTDSLAEFLAIHTTHWQGGEGPFRHIVGGVSVNQTGESTATAHHYCSYFSVGDEMKPVGMGEYWDEFALCSDGRWRLKRRRMKQLTPLSFKTEQ